MSTVVLLGPALAGFTVLFCFFLSCVIILCSVRSVRRAVYTVLSWDCVSLNGDVSKPAGEGDMTALNIMYFL